MRVGLVDTDGDGEVEGGATHAVLPAATAMSPRGQGVHADVPAAEKLPMGQSVALMDERGQ